MGTPATENASFLVEVDVCGDERGADLPGAGAHVGDDGVDEFGGAALDEHGTDEAGAGGLEVGGEAGHELLHLLGIVFGVDVHERVDADDADDGVGQPAATSIATRPPMSGRRR
jgi:hypothetical protein